MTEPSISIIVPTFNRAGSLKRLLASLDRLERPGAHAVEVVIVDNGSTDGTESILKLELTKPRWFLLTAIRETRRGKANALNAGLAAAKGTLILVMDDDVVVDPQCLLKHVECHDTTNFDAAQGRVIPGVDPRGNSADPHRLDEYNVLITDYGESTCEISGLTGTNMSFRREVVEKVGRFNPRLGPGAAGYSEDTEFSIRLRRAGFKIGYTPHAIVSHELNPERYGRKYNRDAEYRKGVSRSIYRDESIFFRVIPQLLANCARYGIYRLFGLHHKVYKTEGRIMKSWGYLSGKLRSSTPKTSKIDG